MRADTREGKPVDETPLPEFAQPALRHVLIAAHEPHELGSRGEAVSQNRLQDVEVTVTDAALVGVLGPDEFGKAGHRKTAIETGYGNTKCGARGFKERGGHRA